MTETMPRVVSLEGASNVRDLGGWPARQGRVRFGRVFRSASLARITERDQAALDALPIRTICDFRGAQERALAPSALDRVPHVAVHTLPIEPSIGASLRDIVGTREATGEDVFGLLGRAYVAYALDWSHRYRAMFELLLNPGAYGMLIHCSAGKDRTGFGAALILAALDVPYEAIEEDYLATNRLWRGGSEIARLVPPRVADVLLRVHAALLRGGFEAVRDRYGTTDAYLEQACGLSPQRREALRRLLIA